MLIKTYGIFDTVAKTLRSTFTADNDEVALRSCVITAKDPRADRDTLKDCVVKYLYSVDSSDGSIVDIAQKDIITFAAILENVPEDVDNKSMAEIQDMFKKLRQSYDSIGKSFEQQSNLNETFVGRLNALEKLFEMHNALVDQVESLEKKINDIIGGKIKCQKYKKTRK